MKRDTMNAPAGKSSLSFSADVLIMASLCVAETRYWMTYMTYMTYGRAVNTFMNSNRIKKSERDVYDMLIT